MSARAAAGVGARARDATIAAICVLLAGLVIASAVQTVGAGRHLGNPAVRLRRDPLDLPALRDRALGWDRGGDPDRAEAALSFVMRRTWRDAPTLGWLLRSRTEDGRLDEAMQIADAVIRQDGRGAARPVLFPALIAATGDQEARTALEARLELSPFWRGDFLRALGTSGDPSPAASVFAALAAGPTPPTPAEYAPFIDRLVDAKAYVAAAGAWRDITRRAGALPKSGEVMDFALAGDGTPFTWRSADGAGAGSSVGEAPEDAGRIALRVDYDGFASPVLPARLLTLEPGRYLISWRERREGAGASVLSWRVRCADTGEILAGGPPVDQGGTSRDAGGEKNAGVGGAAWRARSMEVQVPAGVCAGQWLELAATPGERRSPTTTWWESLEVSPST
jgi:hypothetical protein